ncbi:MAG: hypothetical protein Q7U32_05205, partial [Rhodocyclaceae bacterium]|nr:hypothetical protein [Rhodocyclaceae bacterium]
NPLPHRFDVTKVPQSQAVKARRHPGPHPLILEPHAPLPECLGLLYLDHCESKCSLLTTFYQGLMLSRFPAINFPFRSDSPHFSQEIID